LNKTKITPGTKWYSNIVYPPNIAAVYVGSFFKNSSSLVNNQFENNTFISGIAEYDSLLGNNNFTVNDVSTVRSIFKIGQGGSYSYLNMSFSGRKKVAVRVQNVTVSSLSFPFDDVFNRSSGRVLAFGLRNFSVGVGPGQVLVVGDFGSAPVSVDVSGGGGGGGGALTEYVLNSTKGVNITKTNNGSVVGVDRSVFGDKLNGFVNKIGSLVSKKKPRLGFAIITVFSFVVYAYYSSVRKNGKL
jgi:hypothetical protein